MQSVFLLIAMSFIVQFLVDRIKGILPDKASYYIKPSFWSITLSLLLTFTFRLDVFAVLGVASDLTYLPRILTAVAVSAGADPLHNFFARIREWRKLK